MASQLSGFATTQAFERKQWQGNVSEELIIASRVRLFPVGTGHLSSCASVRAYSMLMAGRYPGPVAVSLLLAGSYFLSFRSRKSAAAV